VGRLVNASSRISRCARHRARDGWDQSVLLEFAIGSYASDVKKKTPLVAHIFKSRFHYFECFLSLLFVDFKHQSLPEQIRSFLTVVEEGSLHRVAARLRMSQPGLSGQMQGLENESGGRLLERTTTTLPSLFLQRLVEADLRLFDALATERPSP
jgi:Bacterial regulatory helix-turn-helix protein, lysR family